MIDYKKEILDRANWIKGIVESAHADGVMLGLSGGKDSAVVAALCHEAGLNICGTYLPIESHPEKDLPFILPLVEKFSIEFIPFTNEQLVPIWASMKAIIKPDFDLTQKDFDRLSMATANIKARMRMTLIYSLAQVRNYLVAGTGNASEAYVGYFTKWGDGAHDFNPIGDLAVSEVVALGDALGLPKEIVHRVPSAGLWEGQTDESEMGVSYSEIERVMKDMPVHNSDGVIDYDKTQKIRTMHSRTEHKRNPIPIYKR